MGTNCAPFLANIYLHVFEYNYLQNLVDNNQIDVAKKLSNLLRYQDDCISLNDDILFNEHFAHMYPREMIYNIITLSIIGRSKVACLLNPKTVHQSDVNTILLFIGHSETMIYCLLS